MQIQARNARYRWHLAALALAAHSAFAVPLPPPPQSPAPVTDYEYDAKGKLTKVTKAKGVVGFGFAHQTAYDPLERVQSTTNAKSGVSTLVHDGQDQITKVTDPRNLITQYQRDGLGQVRQLSSPDTGVATSSYDAAGNLLTRTDSRGVTQTYTYDSLSRPKTLVLSQSGQAGLNYSWTYDQTGSNHGYGVGRLTTATAPGGTTQYRYDAQGRVVQSTQIASSVTLSTSYAYNAAGQVTSITYPSGRILTVSYLNGQPASVSLAKDSGSTTQPLVSQIQWAPFGAPSSWQWHMGAGLKAHERLTDNYGRLVRYTLGGMVRDVSYDAADRIVQYTHLDVAAGAATPATQALDQSFGYDELDRLTSITTASAGWSIGYDANGNRTSVTLNGATRDYTTSATSNRLDAITNPARSFGYDAMGNTLSDTAGYTATYALDGRLTTLLKDGVTTTYAYDAAGQRVAKTVGNQRKLFVYDLEGRVLGEYGGDGSPLMEYVWLGDQPLAVFQPLSQTDDKVYYIHTDHLNTPRLLLEPTGAVRWRWLADPFGVALAEDNPSGYGVVNFNLRFPGQYFDKESGLHYNYFRDYDASTGRYVQSDPIGLAGGLNTYLYVAGDPVSLLDPDGRQAQVAGVVCGPGYVLCACAITAVTWGIYSSRADKEKSSSSAVHDLDNRKQRQYEAAKARCTPPNPDDQASCSEISKMIDMLINSKNRYIYWDAKYFASRHAVKIEQIENRIKALKERYDRECTNCKK